MDSPRTAPTRALRRGLTTTVMVVTGTLIATSAAAVPTADDTAGAEAVAPFLRDAAPEGFYIGTTAAGGGHHADADYPEPFPNDPAYRAIIAQEFSSLTPENQMKWNHLRPDSETYNFGPVDDIMEFAEDNGQEVRGHTLFWHSQNPEWLENGDFTAEELREMLREHVTTVVGRYAGQVYQWDVANEIFDDDGELRTEDNIWIRELGPEIVADVFRWAHEADPEAKLFFNDYNAEGINPRTDAYYELAEEFLDEGVPVHGFGAQAHLSLLYGFDDSLQENLQRFADLGLETAITELDVRIPLGESGEPTEEQLAEQASRYGRVLEACLAVETCNSFTVWGINDAHSWVPGTFPGEGAANILWEDNSPKPAYYTLLEILEEAEEPGEPQQPGTQRYGFFLNDGWDAWADHVFQYGRFSDEVLIGDWDGDGTDTITIRRGNEFHVSNAQQGGDAEEVVRYGRDYDTVLVGDWDGDGTDTLAVRRGSEYHIKNTIAGGPADVVVRYGYFEDPVVVGDWDGDNIDTLAVRRTNGFHIKNSLTGGNADAVVQYGRPSDVVLAGDWDGDGHDTFAVRRGFTYHVKNSLTGGEADIVLNYGRADDEVYVGDWDGEGTDTLGVRRVPATS